MVSFESMIRTCNLIKFRKNNQELLLATYRRKEGIGLVGVLSEGYTSKW
jgi:hypothetical protein